MFWIRPSGGMPGGVTSVQVSPSSRVTCTGPSLAPVQITPGSTGDSSMTYRTE